LHRTDLVLTRPGPEPEQHRGTGFFVPAPRRVQQRRRRLTGPGHFEGDVVTGEPERGLPDLEPPGDASRDPPGLHEPRPDHPLERPISRIRERLDRRPVIVRVLLRIDLDPGTG